MPASINRCGNTRFMDFQCRNLADLNLVLFLKVKYIIFLSKYDLFVKITNCLSKVNIFLCNIYLCFIDCFSLFVKVHLFKSKCAPACGFALFFLSGAGRWVYTFAKRSPTCASINRCGHILIDAAASVNKCGRVYK